MANYTTYRDRQAVKKQRSIPRIEDDAEGVNRSWKAALHEVHVMLRSCNFKVPLEKALAKSANFKIDILPIYSCDQLPIRGLHSIISNDSWKGTTLSVLAHLGTRVTSDKYLLTGGFDWVAPAVSGFLTAAQPSAALLPLPFLTNLSLSVNLARDPTVANQTI
jgi:hypothetical protein